MKCCFNCHLGDHAASHLEDWVIPKRVLCFAMVVELVLTGKLHPKEFCSGKNFEE